MPISWPKALRESLDSYLYMGDAYVALTAEERSQRGYFPAKFRFEQLPSILDANGERALDVAVNRVSTPVVAIAEDKTASPPVAYQPGEIAFLTGDETDDNVAYGLGYAFALAIRHMCDGGAPITPERSQIASRQARILGRTAFENEMFSLARALVSDLPLQVQNMLLSSGLIPLDAGKPGSQIVSLDGNALPTSGQAPSPADYLPRRQGQFVNRTAGIAQRIWVDSGLTIDPRAEIAYIQTLPLVFNIQRHTLWVNPWLIPFTPRDLTRLKPSAAGETVNSDTGAVFSTGISIGALTWYIGRQAENTPEGYLKLNIASASRSGMWTDRRIRLFW